MALPTSRDITADGSTPVSSSVTNRLQDCIVGQKKPEHWRYQPFARGWVETNIAFDTAAVYGTGQIAATTSAPVYSGPCLIDLQAGDRITGASVEIYGTGGVQTVPVILARGHRDAVSVIANIQAVNPAAAWNVFSDLTPTYIVLASDVFFWEVQAGLNTTKYGRLGIRIDRL